MPKKAKKKKFSAVKQVKAMAREQVGNPPVTRAVPTVKEREKRRTGKHKRTLGKLLEEAE